MRTSDARIIAELMEQLIETGPEGMASAFTADSTCSTCLIWMPAAWNSFKRELLASRASLNSG